MVEHPFYLIIMHFILKKKKKNIVTNIFDINDKADDDDWKYDRDDA